MGGRKRRREVEVGNSPTIHTDRGSGDQRLALLHPLRKAGAEPNTVWSLEVLLALNWEAGRARRSEKKLTSLAGVQSRASLLLLRSHLLLRGVGNRHAPRHSVSLQGCSPADRSPLLPVVHKPLSPSSL